MRALRDSQLTSTLFDHEVSALLQAQLARALLSFGPTAVSRYMPEVRLVVNSAVFYLSVFKSGKTYGQALQNATYSPLSRRQRILLGVAFVVVPYVWARVSETAIDERWAGMEHEDWEYVVWKWMTRMEAAHKLVVLLNFVAFLWSGVYPHYVERLLGVTITTARRGARAVAFEYMNRELMWQGLTEFLLFATPLVNLTQLQNFFRRKIAAANPSLPDTQCGICNEDPINLPHASSVCGHAMCYLCVASKLEEDESFPCPKCGGDVTKENLTRL